MNMTLKYGSRGEDVKELQNALNQSGYSLDTDGVYGNKTQAAVRDYQQKNGLAVDGIAGNETLGALKKAGSGTATAAAQQPTQTGAQSANTPAAPTYTSYDPGTDAAYQSAVAALQQVQQKTPSYAGTYDAQLNDIYQQIVGRDKFSYDINGDALYQQYADQYRLGGKLAMMDTIGQAAQLTGGYGNSYAQNAGQQAYNAYMQRLNEVVPELYSQAYQQYMDEGDALRQQYAMLGDLSDQEYGRYQDAYNRWLTERGYAQDAADTAYNRGYQSWADEQAQREADRDYQWQLQQFEYQKERDRIADEQWQKQFDLSAWKAAASGGSGTDYQTQIGTSKNYGDAWSAARKYMGQMTAGGASRDGLYNILLRYMDEGLTPDDAEYIMSYYFGNMAATR